MNELKHKPKICKRDYTTVSSVDYVLLAPDLDSPLVFHSKVDLILESMKHTESKMYKLVLFNLEK